MIELRGITKTYAAGKETIRALGPLDLRIAPGERLMVTGPSGSGKSTLLALLGCLERPSEGTYTLDGVDVSRLTEAGLAQVRRDRMGFVFQRFHLIEELDVFANVALPLIYRGWPADARRRAVEESLIRVGLASKMRSRPSQLSGGEQQRVAIARAVAGGPEILLADEPTGNLDSVTGERIVGLLVSLQEERPGNILVVVTHNLELPVKPNRTIVLRDGRIDGSGV